MNVYAVIWTHYDNQHLDSIWLTRQLAQAYIDLQTYAYKFSIEERHVFDEL